MIGSAFGLRLDVVDGMIVRDNAERSDNAIAQAGLAEIVVTLQDAQPQLRPAIAIPSLVPRTSNATPRWLVRMGHLLRRRGRCVDGKQQASNRREAEIINVLGHANAPQLNLPEPRPARRSDVDIPILTKQAKLRHWIRTDGHGTTASCCSKAPRQCAPRRQRLSQAVQPAHDRRCPATMGPKATGACHSQIGKLFLSSNPLAFPSCLSINRQNSLPDPLMQMVKVTSSFNSLLSLPRTSPRTGAVPHTHLSLHHTLHMWNSQGLRH